MAMFLLNVLPQFLGGDAGLLTYRPIVAYYITRWVRHEHPFTPSPVRPFCMFPSQVHGPSNKVLRELNRLQRSSPNFPNLLVNLLRIEERKAPGFFYNLHSKDKVWLIEYLDNVCVFCRVYSLLSLDRSSIPLIPLVLHTMNAYVNS